MKMVSYLFLVSILLLQFPATAEEAITRLRANEESNRPVAYQSVNVRLGSPCSCLQEGESSVQRNEPGEKELLSLKHYADILEKTNSQLSLSHNPFSLFVSALGVLFAVGAVVLGYYIYRQGNEYRSYALQQAKEYFGSFEKMRLNYAGLLERIEKDHVEARQKVEQSLNKFIEEAKANLEKAEGHSKTMIQKEIDRLNALKKEVSNNATQSAVKTDFYFPVAGSMVSGVSGYSGYSPIAVKCEKCGHRYSASNPIFSPSSLIGTRPHATCPNCGNLNPL